MRQHPNRLNSDAFRHVLVRALVLFAVVSQLLPPSGALAYSDGNLTFVMCGVNGAQSISWEDIAGAPAHSGIPEAGASDHCAACFAGCRAKHCFGLADIYLPGVDLHAFHPEEFQSPPPDDLHAAGPPLPSRSPPLKAA